MNASDRVLQAMSEDYFLFALLYLTSILPMAVLMNIIHATFKSYIIRRKEARLIEAKALCNAAVIHEQSSQGSAKEAAALLAKAHENSTAINNLAVLTECGKGVEKDVAKAMSLYKRAIELGNPIALFNLGLLLKCSDASYVDTELADVCFEKLSSGQNMEHAKELDTLIDRVRDAEKSITILKDDPEIVDQVKSDGEGDMWNLDVEKHNECFAYVKNVSPRASNSPTNLASCLFDAPQPSSPALNKPPPATNMERDFMEDEIKEVDGIDSE